MTIKLNGAAIICTLVALLALVGSIITAGDAQAQAADPPCFTGNCPPQAPLWYTSPQDFRGDPPGAMCFNGEADKLPHRDWSETVDAARAKARQRILVHLGVRLETLRRELHELSRTKECHTRAKGAAVDPACLDIAKKTEAIDSRGEERSAGYVQGISDARTTETTRLALVRICIQPEDWKRSVTVPDLARIKR